MPQQGKDLRLGALWRFAIAISVFNALGHTVLGFEQSWAHPLVALATGYAVELLLEWVDARAHGRPPRFRGGARRAVEFLLPAHITSLAVSMLLYPNARLMPIVFACAAAVCSKYLFRITDGGRSRHFFNPSNFGITLTLLAFHWVGIAPPYMFTENLTGVGDWILPGILVCTGSFLNIRFTKRWPLIAAWLSTFALQAVLRSAFGGTPVTAALLPMTGLAFLLFTFYMVSDPSTTPSSIRGQVLFGAAVAAVYGLLLSGQVVFTLFFALSIVCTLRGAQLYASAWAQRRRTLRPAAVPLPVGAPRAGEAAAFAPAKGLERQAS